MVMHPGLDSHLDDVRVPTKRLGGIETSTRVHGNRRRRRTELVLGEKAVPQVRVAVDHLQDGGSEADGPEVLVGSGGRGGRAGLDGAQVALLVAERYAGRSGDASTVAFLLRVGWLPPASLGPLVRVDVLLVRGPPRLLRSTVRDTTTKFAREQKPRMEE